MTRFALAFVVAVLIVVPAVTAKWQVDNGPVPTPRQPQLGRPVVTAVAWDAIRVACERRADHWYRCPGGNRVR
jgi:hypothetical protein